MKTQNLGETIASLRKQKAMTQADLAQRMNVTDKAVSKWERNLSCPDIHSIPKLAEALDTTVEELLNAQKNADGEAPEKISNIVTLALNAVGLAMGVATAVLALLQEIESNSALVMLGIGLTCISITLLQSCKL